MTSEHYVVFGNQFWVYCKCGDYFPATSEGNPLMKAHVQQQHILPPPPPPQPDAKFSYHSPLLETPPTKPTGSVCKFCKQPIKWPTKEEKAQGKPNFPMDPDGSDHRCRR